MGKGPLITVTCRFMSTAASGGPVPGIVVVHGRSGLEDFTKDVTHMLALGLRCGGAPLLYHRDGAG
jgi:dienelactone hydrolase